MAQPWEVALEEFIGPWRARREVVGALVAGSRAYGLADRYSDIDVFIVMANRVKWRERGNRKVGGYLVEYFANPLRMYPRYYKQGSQGGSRAIATMFGHGRVLFDKDGSMRRMRAWGRRVLRIPLARPDRMTRESAKYHLWATADGLMSLRDRRSPGFWYAYYTGLDRAIESYRAFVGGQTPAEDKMWQMLISARFRRAHRMPPFRDRRFTALVKRCIRAKHPAVATRDFSRLVAHIHRRMGGFQVDGWKLRTKAG
jgi:hypothetical protein